MSDSDPPTLNQKLLAALETRQSRSMRRRLPNPDHAPTSNHLMDFNSNDYLSLSTSPALRELFLQKLDAAPSILGSGGSRLLVNGAAHQAFESRLRDFFKAECALLFNSGYDANVGLFSCIPQPGDFVVYDEFIHASVHDGLRASRIPKTSMRAFDHNSVPALESVLSKLSREPSVSSGASSVFIAVESLYSMDGTFSPLREIVDLVERYFTRQNGYIIVDEAHATGIYGIQGRGRVAMLNLEDKIFVRLHTFGKALAATGGRKAF
jgi:8-amino-7-oxononanoate synthase